MSLMKTLQSFVLRIAEEINKTEKVAKKNKPMGYPGLNSDMKISLEQIDIGAILAPIGTVSWNNKKVKPQINTQFTLSLKPKNWATTDKVCLQSADKTSTILPSTYAVDPSGTEILATFVVGSSGNFTLCVVRFGSLISSTDTVLTII